MDRTNTYIKKIEKDHARFREIIRGQIRKDLRKYISNGEMIGRQGKYTVSIPLPQLRLPTFRYGQNDRTGVGQGPGDVGTPIAAGDEQKEIVRTEAFWIDTWLRSQYKKLETRYIIHDAAAKEVDRETFYHLKESGGTKISTAYQLCSELIRKDYNPTEWNIYPFHFSDGVNWGSEDTKRCMELLGDDLFPRGNVFCYGQGKSAYGSGQFKKDLDDRFPKNEQLPTSAIRDNDSIPDSTKHFLGTG